MGSRIRDNLGGPEVGQVVLPATPRGSPAAREWQVNVPLTRNNDLPYGFFSARRFSVTEPGKPGRPQWRTSRQCQPHTGGQATSAELRIAG